MSAFIQLTTIIMCFCAVAFSLIMIIEQIKMPAKTGPAWAAKLILISMYLSLIVLSHFIVRAMVS